MFVGVAVEELEKVRRDGLFDQETCAGQADLARIIKLSGCFLGSCFQVGIAKDQERAFASEFSGERNDVPRHGDTDMSCGLWRPGERNSAYTPIADESGTNFLTNSLHDVENTRRQSRTIGQVGQNRG